MKMQNEAKYKLIAKELKANPNASVVKLCEKQGVAYQSFNNWRKLQLADDTQVSIDLQKVAVAEASGKEVVTFSIAEILDGLSTDAVRSYNTYFGEQVRMLKKRTDSKGNKGGKSKDVESDD